MAMMSTMHHHFKSFIGRSEERLIERLSALSKKSIALKGHYNETNRGRSS